jgi:protein-tyrosine-phosphatase
MKYVLFVCNHNAGRSQMAQAFFERYAPPDIRAESAGDEPAAAIWPNVIEAMHEVGIEIGDRRPKRLDLEMQLHADFAITLACGAECPYVAADVEEWDIPDPAGHSLEEVREIRDLIEDKIRELIATRLDDLRASPTAHRLRRRRRRCARSSSSLPTGMPAPAWRKTAPHSPGSGRLTVRN